MVEEIVSFAYQIVLASCRRETIAKHPLGIG
jgi:hypothetical protein